jgi:hypothetical protein
MSAHRTWQLFVGLSLLCIAGCAVFGRGEDHSLQKNPNFREGYEDGCAAATNHGADLRDRPVGDQQLLAKDEAYREGWNTGFHTCRRSDLEPNAAPGDSPLKLPGPGH